MPCAPGRLSTFHWSPPLESIFQDLISSRKNRSPSEIPCVNAQPGSLHLILGGGVGVGEAQISRHAPHATLKPLCKDPPRTAPHSDLSPSHQL